MHPVVTLMSLRERQHTLNKIAWRGYLQKKSGGTITCLHTWWQDGHHTKFPFKFPWLVPTKCRYFLNELSFLTVTPNAFLHLHLSATTATSWPITQCHFLHHSYTNRCSSGTNARLHLWICKLIWSCTSEWQSHLVNFSDGYQPTNYLK